MVGSIRALRSCFLFVPFFLLPWLCVRDRSFVVNGYRFVLECVVCCLVTCFCGVVPFMSPSVPQWLSMRPPVSACQS